MLELGVISKVSVWLLEQVCSHVRFVNVFARMWMFGWVCVEYTKRAAQGKQLLQSDERVQMGKVSVR